MKHQLGMMIGLSALMIGPAMAQQQPNPNQAAAKALLQAADKAMGASFVKGWTASGTGWMGYPGQQYAQAICRARTRRTLSKQSTSPASLAVGSGRALRGIIPSAAAEQAFLSRAR
jgi:O-acetyl-ADP-ribose deacetylase (regulator of RNase III)